MSDIKVAKVIDEYSFVINKGKDYGLKDGQRVLVYELGEDIIDPDTKDVLTQLEIVKGTGKILNCQDKIATVKSTMVSDPKRTIIKKSSSNSLGHFTTLFSAMRPEVSEVVEEIVPANALPFEDVNVGDWVRLL